MKTIIQIFLILVACESFAVSKTHRPTADAMVRSDSPNRNYGNKSRVGADTSAREYGYFRFNVDGITGKVNSAKVRFFVLNKTVNGPRLRLVDGDWQEREVTYKNRPAFTSRAIADTGALANNKYVEFDVTDTVRSNGKYNLGFDADSKDGMSVGSRESSTPPELIVDQSPGDSDPEPNPGLITLNVKKRGSGQGIVLSNPSGIDCGSDCGESYKRGIRVNIEATPRAGSKFAGWTGDCRSFALKPICTLNMKSNQTAVANFESAAPPPNPGPSPVGGSSFACLETADEVIPVTGNYNSQFEPSTAKGRAFDARTAEFDNTRVDHGMIQVRGSSNQTDMCWAGGYIQSNRDWDSSWDDHKDKSGPARNNSGFYNLSTGLTATGVHIFNVGDGFRSNSGFKWVVQHSWAEYIRDDCIENDHFNSGRVFDTLLDGCYAGISTRPSSSDRRSDGGGKVIELDRVLLRLQAMPYPYKWKSKGGSVIDSNGDRYSGSGIPYGHGSLFKEDKDTRRNAHFKIKNSVFLLPHITRSQADFPAESLIDTCEDVTVVWLGPGDYPGKLPTKKFPNCVTVLKGQEGLDFWKQKVEDWHSRHPDVGADRKPLDPGRIEFPRKF